MELTRTFIENRIDDILSYHSHLRKKWIFLQEELQNDPDNKKLQARVSRNQLLASQAVEMIEYWQKKIFQLSYSFQRSYAEKYAIKTALVDTGHQIGQRANFCKATLHISMNCYDLESRTFHIHLDGQLKKVPLQKVEFYATSLQKAMAIIRPYEFSRVEFEYEYDDQSMYLKNKKEYLKRTSK